MAILFPLMLLQDQRSNSNMKDTVELYQKFLMGCEFAAAFAGIVTWRRNADFRMTYFRIYLCFISVSELLGWYLKHNGYKELTSQLYAFFVIPCEFLFSFWLAAAFSLKKSLKKGMLVLALSGALVNVFEIAFLRSEKFFFSSLAYLVYSFFLLIVVLVFLWEFVKSDAILNPWDSMIFWICISWLQYYLLTFPLYAFYNLLYNLDKSSFMAYWKVQMILNMLMYLLFFTGIIWTSRKFK